MSGGSLLQIKLKAAPTGSVAPFDAQVFGFTTADTDKPGISLGGEAPITFYKGFLVGDLITSNSADASQGKGVFSSFIKGRGELADITSDEATPLSSLLFSGVVPIIGAEVWIASISSTGTITNHVQLGVDDFEATDEGTIELTFRSLSFLRNRPLFGVRTTSEILTDPEDSTNPTDPLYQQITKTPQFTGTALGGVPVSLKSAQPLTAVKFCWFAETSLATGSIATTGSGANVVATTGNDFFYFHTLGGLEGTMSAIYFWMRADSVDPAHPESQRFVALLKQYAENGYRVVLSDGDWFLDLTEFGTPDEVFGAHADGKRVFYFNRADYGSVYAHDGVGVLLNEKIVFAGSPGEALFPADGLDPSRVSFYAVPTSISVASIQCVVDGLARNKKTVTIGGEAIYLDGITAFAPSVVSTDSFVGITAVPELALTFDNSVTGRHLGGIQDIENNAINTLSGAGDIADVNTNPAVTWQGFGTPPIYFRDAQGSPGSFQLGARVYARPSVTKFDADIFVVESTYKATFESNPAHSGDAFMVAAGPLQRTMEYGIKNAFSGGSTYTIEKIAKRNLRNPRWGQSYKNIGDLSQNATPYVQAAWTGIRIIQAVQLDVYECIVWAYTKFAFSDIYATILPFWTRGPCAAIAANGEEIVCNSGKGIISADGSISWSAFAVAPPSATGRPVQIASACVVPALSLWVMVGSEGGDHTSGNIAWSSTDGSTWSSMTLPGVPTANPFRVRHLGSNILVMHSLGINGLALGAQFDCCYNGSSTFVFCGAAGSAHWTADFVTTNSVGPGGSADLNAAAYFNGYYYLGASNGTIYRANETNMKAGVWQSIFLSPAAAITDFASNGTSLICTTAYGIFATDDGVTWNWVQKDFIYTAAVGYGWNFGLLHTTVSGTGVWVMGSSAQAFTSTSVDQGGSLPPDWVPWRAHTPGLALQNLRALYFGGSGARWNPIQWSYGGGQPTNPNTRSFGLAIPPPSSVTGADRSGMTAEKAARQICEEQWIFAGEMPQSVLDGHLDIIDVDIPNIGIGQRQDLANLLNIQFQPFGGEYLGLAYIQNIDVPYAAGNDKFYFDGWGSNGLTIWNACRASYLATGIAKSYSKAMDTVHSATVLGELMVMNDADLGRRLDWIIDRPRYFRVRVHGNDSAGAKAYTGCRYKPNPLMLEARGFSIGRNGYGLVVDCQHNFTTGIHEILLALPPKADA